MIPPEMIQPDELQREHDALMAHLPRGPKRKRPLTATQEEILRRAAKWHNLRNWIAEYEGIPSGPRSLGKVFCSHGRHWVKPGEVHAAYRNLAICDTCNVAAGYHRADLQAQAEVAHGQS